MVVCAFEFFKRSTFKRGVKQKESSHKKGEKQIEKKARQPYRSLVLNNVT